MLGTRAVGCRRLVYNNQKCVGQLRIIERYRIHVRSVVSTVRLYNAFNGLVLIYGEFICATTIESNERRFFVLYLRGLEL